MKTLKVTYEKTSNFEIVIDVKFDVVLVKVRADIEWILLKHS